eukprot:CAMPEP_0176479254 /NCGR_PEP_ID=MMETSP0200_2-20121128/1641_1 /TAXON_ID=947934 /ORGANISM="Chaetoceros sp., Strain GSL56" /LENGTH=1260 /DNA_ID=CAMNT_0017875285 /DNA_START=79 /DNA_END=3858 /DNA_ORIENTATION=+
MSTSNVSPTVPRPMRLRSTAKYSLFNPSALAATQSLCILNSSISSNAASTTASAPSSSSTSPSSFYTPTSLAAISSKTNAAIILFHLGRPYEPTLVYHSTYNQSNKTNLQFSPDSKMLAASYDSSVFIYDCKGEALQPLITRLTSGVKRELINGIHWRGLLENNPNYNSACQELVTWTDHVVAQWDLRMNKKPSLSFNGRDGFVSVTMEKNEMATISSNGIVAVYDIRKHSNNGSSLNHSTGNEEEASHPGILHKYAAHGIGLGIDRLNHNWITWGMDEQDQTVVKLWSQNVVTRQGSFDNYWSVEHNGGFSNSNSNTNSNSNSSHHGGGEEEKTSKNENEIGLGCTDDHGYNSALACLAQVKVDHLTTVKVVCHRQNESADTLSQSQEKNGFVTVSCPTLSYTSDAFGSGHTQNLWQADLWTMSKGSNHTNTIQTECLASFQCGGSTSSDQSISQMIGKEYLDGHLIAAELSFLGTDALMTPSIDDGQLDKCWRRGNCELILCSLTSNGFLTTHAIPEAIQLKGRHEKENGGVNKTSPFRFQVGSYTNLEKAAKVFDKGATEEGATNALKEMSNFRLGRPRNQSDMDVYKSKPTNIVDLGPIEGGVMQFDLEEEPLQDLKGAKEDIISNDLLEQHTKSDLPMESIDMSTAKNVPSPRPCGAVFGVDGTLFCFHNGNLKNMWKWYKSGQQASSKSQSDARSVSPPPALLSNYGDISGKNDDEFIDNITIYPRSFWDLMKMNESAKIAQWGKERDDEDGDNGANNGSQSSSSSDDETSESSGSEEMSMDSVSDSSCNGMSASAMYETYFGKLFDFKMQFETPKVHSRSSEKKRLTHSPESCIAPAAENLEPKVFLTRNENDIVMNGQCPDLSDGWIFGPWQHDPNRFTRHISDLAAESKISEEGYANGLGVVSNDQRRRETMVGNLQKLYYQDTKKNTLSSVPLDQKVMQKKEKLTNTDIEVKEVNSSSQSPRMERISASSVMRPDAAALKMLKQKVDICLHNAKCATALGQMGKADVWKMLAEIIRSVSGNFYDDFDGWHNMNGSALGRELIRNILRYYEMNGDVQMLATIITVFDVHSYTRNLEQAELYPSNLFDLLLPYDICHDMYIHFYSQLLYCWGKLITRAELNKHLSQRAMYFDSYGVSTLSHRNKDIFVPCCQRCNRLANPETNICQYCNEYAFRCSICTNAIRGLFTVCKSCGHGGHVNHIMPWFAERSVCPTGCGCTCTLTILNEETVTSSSSNAQQIFDMTKNTANFNHG